jgi:hypothetical protein
MISLLRTLLVGMEATIPEPIVVGVRSPSEPSYSAGVEFDFFLFSISR